VATVFNHQLLRQWRDESGLRPEEVAFKAGVSFSHLLRLESVGGRPSGDLITRIARVYGHDPGELYTTDDTPAGAR
jgi:transcriptional regulator with XRE-family HTH domain